MYLYILIFIKKILKFSFYVVGFNAILLQAVARCQATIDEQNGILKEVLATLKSCQGVSCQGQKSRTEEFAPINKILSVATMSDFDELNKKVECEQQFEKLLVSWLVHFDLMLYT